MEKSRLTAFSDGVIAVIITIMVLELKLPHTPDWAALKDIVPGFLSYLLSFLYIAIYWNNHHHLLYAAKHVNGAVLWANLHLLFWLSLIPLATAWSERSLFAPAPAAMYGIVLLAAALAYYILQTVIVRTHGEDSLLKIALGRDVKGKLSLCLYALAIALSFIMPALSYLIYIGVACLWLVPDRRIEKKFNQDV